MARTRQIQRPPEIPRTATSRGGTTRSKSALAMLIVSALAAFWALAMLTPAGRIVYVYMFVYLEFYLGPVTLVSLSLATMLGVAATDRSVLTIRQRVVLQSAHRALGIIAVGSLVVHVMTKVAADRLSLVDALIPFISGRGIEGLWIGMGTIAAYLMFFTIWTGIIRARFVGVGKKWMWRALHSAVYVSWPIGILHGLKAGRAAAAWVTVSYIACVLLVVIALLLRLAASIGRKRKEATQTTGSIKAVGKPVQTGSESWTTLAGAARRIAGGRERVAREPRETREARESFAGGLAAPDPLTDSWVRFGDSRKVDSPGQRSNRFAVPEVPLPRAAAARSAPEDPWDSPRRWSAERSAPEDPWDSPRRWSGDERPAAYKPRYGPVEQRTEVGGYREEPRETPRRRVVEDAPVAQTRRRPAPHPTEEVPLVEPRRGRAARYAEDEEEAPLVEPRRGRAARYADEDESPVVEPRHGRAARYAEDEEEVPLVEPRRGRAARYAEDEEEVPLVEPRRGRAARYAEEAAPVAETRRRTPRYAEEDESPVAEPRRGRAARYAEDEEEAPLVEPRRGRAARYADEDESPVVEPRHGRAARYAEDEEEVPLVEPRRGRAARYAEDEEEVPLVEPRRGRAARYAEEAAPVAETRRRTPRYAEEDESPVAEPRRGRAARYAEDEQEAPLVEPRRGRVARYVEDDLLPDDDTPTLVDLASRRAKRAAAAESGSGSKSRKKRAAADVVDEAYWATLRGEAQ